MKNDLTQFEKGLLRTINFMNNEKFTHHNFMEWNTNKKTVEKNLQKGEVIYEVSGAYVAINKEQG